MQGDSSSPCERLPSNWTAGSSSAAYFEGPSETIMVANPTDQWGEQLLSYDGAEIAQWLPVEFGSTCSTQSNSPLPSPTFVATPYLQSPIYLDSPPSTTSSYVLSPNFEPSASSSSFARAQDAYLTHHTPLTSPEFIQRSVPSTPKTTFTIPSFATPPRSHTNTFSLNKEPERPPFHRRFASAPSGGDRQIYNPNLSIVVPPLETVPTQSSAGTSSPVLLSPNSPGFPRRPVPRRSRFLSLEEYAPVSTTVDRAFEQPSILGAPFVQSPPASLDSPTTAYPTPTQSSSATFPSFAAYLDQSNSPVTPATPKTPTRKDSTASAGYNSPYPIPKLTITRPLSIPEPYEPPSPPFSPSLNPSEYSPSLERPIVTSPGSSRPFPSVLMAPTAPGWSSVHPKHSDEEPSSKKASQKKTTPRKKKAATAKTRHTAVQVGNLKFVNLDSTDAVKLTHGVAKSGAGGVSRKKKADPAE